MQRSNFNPRTNPFPTHHQIHQFPSQIPQNPPTINPYNPHYIPQFQPSNHPFNPQIPPSNHRSSSSLDYDTKLRDEVIYLHSLWHRGPPPTLNRPSQTPHFLKPSNSTHYKKTQKKFKTSEKTHLISDKEWPVESLPKCPSPSGSSWPEFKPHSAPVTRPATAEERERVLGLKIHLKGLDSCTGLFHREGDNESDDDVEEEEEDDGDDVEEFEFFMKVFEEDSELRGYYEKNCENGEFYCLVCGVIGKKLRRKYKNCVALVQHSITVSNTKKRNAHRAFGHVICKVLGWDVNRLPSLPSTVGDQGEVNNHADGWKDTSAAVEREEDFANTSHSEAGTKVKPDAIQMENDSALDAACLASELTQSAGEVSNHADGWKDNSAAVEREEDFANTSHSEPGTKVKPDSIEMENDSALDAGYLASELTQSAKESKVTVDGCETDGHGGLKEDGVCCKSENAQLEKKNTTNSTQEVSNKLLEGCSALGGKSVDCGMS